MSAPALAFAIYFFIGLVLMSVAIASRNREKRLKGWEAGTSGDIFDAIVIISIAVLWPLWVTGVLKKSDDKPKDPPAN